MKKKSIISAKAICIMAIAGLFTLCSCAKADDVPIVSDTVEIAKDTNVEDVADVTEETEPETEETTPIEPEQSEQDAEITEPEETETEPTEETADELLTDITEMSKVMYAQSEVNTRIGPSVDYERVGSLVTNQEVEVTGQSNVTGWFRILVDNETMFVSNKYLADSKITVTESSTNNTNSSSSTNNGGSTATEMPNDQLIPGQEVPGHPGLTWMGDIELVPGSVNQGVTAR